VRFPPADITWTQYHSPRWAELVEQGWVTAYVDPNGIARMCFPRKKEIPR
jgi:hypothetical protein